jgi:DNA repair protein RecN (Recombination protein N)
MLRSLHLRDFAIASQVELTLGPGMGVITGETGAGKSLLVDALLLLTGARADPAMVRFGAERAELIAEFALDDAPAARQWLADQELDDDGDCQLRRVIRADGGSRAWINGRPATLGQLGALGEQLVEIHGQHEHQALLSRRHQMELLDGFAGHLALVDEVGRLAAEWSTLSRQLAALRGDGDVGERIAWLEHQLAELAPEALAADQIEQLLAAHKRQANAATLIQGCELALARLAGDDGFALGHGLRQVRGELLRLQAHEPRLAEIDQLLDSVQIQLDEATAGLERLRDELDLDPARLAELEQALARLHDLGRKHRVPLEQLGSRRDELAAELARLQGAGEQAAALQTAIERAASAWRAAAERLGDSRRQAAGRLDLAISRLMEELGMAGGRFQAALEAVDGIRPDAAGLERIEFLVSANPGQPPRPLRKVASGGELSRISLAIEVAMLGHDSVPTMIFDEVDSGIGGAIAEVVGQKLRTLGEARQVLCVTHLAQVAAQAGQHYKVEKRESGGHSESHIGLLGAKARIDELARMLGGIEIDAASRGLARSLLARAEHTS